jgi:hypothetical protein
MEATSPTIPMNALRFELASLRERVVVDNLRVFSVYLIIIKIILVNKKGKEIKFSSLFHHNLPFLSLINLYTNNFYLLFHQSRFFCAEINGKYSKSNAGS